MIIHVLTPQGLITILLDRAEPKNHAVITHPPVKYTGLSLSFCVQDVIKGRVAEDSIEKIIAATRMESDEVFEEVIAEYAQGYWYDAPHRGMKIARRLWQKGLIDQPRLRGEKYPNITEGHWMIGGKQIRLPQN